MVGDEIKVAKLTNGQRESVSGRGGVLRELVGKNQGDDPDFNFPLFAGKKWSYQYMATAIGAKKKVARDVEITVHYWSPETNFDFGTGLQFNGLKEGLENQSGKQTLLVGGDSPAALKAVTT